MNDDLRAHLSEVRDQLSMFATGEVNGERHDLAIPERANLAYCVEQISQAMIAESIRAYRASLHVALATLVRGMESGNGVANRRKACRTAYHILSEYLNQ